MKNKNLPDTLNWFALGVRKGKISSLILGREFEFREAENLAAWLLVTLEMVDRDRRPSDEIEARVLALAEAIRGA